MTDGSRVLGWVAMVGLGACADKGVSVGADDSGGGAPVGGVVVLAGGGTEGDEGDDSTWSARLYPHLMARGDVSGDGLVRVAVIASSEQTDWLPGYLESLGADEAFNLTLATAEDADDPSLDEIFAEVDAAFVKGGDQGEYYDLWNDRRVETLLRDLVEVRGGGIGGTSAGAMSQAAYALAGGADYISADALADACTEYLDDVSDGGPGVHDDFLGFVPGVLIDTHFTERARLGRLAGAMALAIEEGAPDDLLGLGIEATTGLVIDGGRAEVIGDGSVALLRATGASALARECGEPLVWTGLALDVLTEGWAFDLEARQVHTDTTPEGATAVAWDGVALPNEGEWYADGDLLRHEERFEWVVGRDPRPYSTEPGTDTPVLRDAIGIMDAHDEDGRAVAAESMFRALADHIGATGFMVGASSSLGRDVDAPSQVRFEDNPAVEDAQVATLVVDSSAATWTSLSPAVSAYDTGDGSLRAAGIVGLTLHVLADTEKTGLAYDSEAHAIVSE